MLGDSIPHRMILIIFCVALEFSHYQTPQKNVIKPSSAHILASSRKVERAFWPSYLSVFSQG